MDHGGLRGIGAAVAEELGRRGARLALTARSEDALRDLVARLPDALVVAGDVTDRERMLAIGEEVLSSHGPVDIAFLNAGTHAPVTPDTFDADIVERHHRVNTMGTVHVFEALMPDMRRRRAGLIAVVASVTGYAALPRAAAYGATKAFLISMCDSLRADLVRDGVGVTVTAPGFVRTGLTEQNDFQMPFVIEADEAARIIVDGLEAGGPHIAFPRRMAALIRFLGCAPAPVRRWWARRLARRLGRS